MQVDPVTLDQHFQELAKMAFPGSPDLGLAEMAFFAGAKTILDMQDQVLRDLHAGRLTYAEGQALTVSWRAQVQAFFHRYAAKVSEQKRRAQPTSDSKPLSCEHTSDAEKIEALRAWDNVFTQTLLPMMADPNKPGLQAVRVFYAARQKDGTISGGNVGAAIDTSMQEILITSILRLLLVPGDDQREWVEDRPVRS